MTRKITSTVAAIARGDADELVLGNLDARRDWGWAPDYVDAMVRAARADEPADYVVATGRAHSVRDFVAAAFAAAGIADWEPLVRQDARVLPPRRPDRAGRRRDAGPATCSAGQPTVALRGDRRPDGGRRPRADRARVSSPSHSSRLRTAVGIETPASSVDTSGMSPRSATSLCWSSPSRYSP